MKNPQHHLFLLWLILTGLILFAAFVLWREGLLRLLYATDKSYICYALTLLYLLITLHAARRTYLISSEANLTADVEAAIRNEQILNIEQAGGRLRLNGSVELPDCYLTSFIRDLLGKRAGRGVMDEPQKSGDLLQVYEAKLKGPHEIGWFCTDIMIKLGLLGTIIGFVLMLSSVANVEDFDVSTMQKVLRLMSTGMGTALYTTLAGLVFSMLTAAQYYLLDRNADGILGTMKHLSEVHLMPRLNQAVN